MKVSVLKEIVDTYISHLNTNEDKYHTLYEYPSRWSAQKDSEDHVVSKLFKTFKSDYTQRLWKRERYRPLETLELFDSIAPYETAEAVNLLLDSQRPLGDRIDLFKFMSEEILTQLRKGNQHKNLADTNWDVQWISLLLSAVHPETYAFYHRDIFFLSAQKLEMNPVPQVDDYPRYMKMVNIVQSFLEKAQISPNRLNQNKFTRSTPEDVAIIKNTAVEALALYLSIDIYTPVFNTGKSRFYNLLIYNFIDME